jgi:type IV pilus assembly protein PilM
MFERTILGLDVGSYAVKAAVVRAGPRSWEFERFAHARLPQGAPPEERQAALSSFIRDNALPLEQVVAAIPSERVTQRHFRFPFSDSRRVARAIPFEIEEELPVPLSGLLLAHEQALSSPEQTDVLAIVCPREEVSEHLSQLRLAGIEPRILEMEGAVLSNLSTSLGLAEASRLVLDIGHRKTTVCLLVDGKPVLLRAVPVAGAQLTEAIGRDLSLPPGVAERHMQEQGLFEATSAKPLGPGVKAMLERLSSEVLRSIQSVTCDPLNAIAPSQVAISGGTAQVPGLGRYLTEKLGLPCTVLAVPEGAAGLSALAAAGPPLYAHAAALALRGAPASRVTRIDFRQREFAYQPDLSELRRGFLLSAGLLVLVFALWIASLGVSVFTTERRIDALEASLAGIFLQAFPESSPTASPLSELEQRVSETRDLADHLGVTQSDLSALELLRAISERLPLELGVVLTELNAEPRTIQARGYATDFESAGRVRTEIQKLDWVEEVRLTDVVTDARRGGKTFNLAIRVREGP